MINTYTHCQSCGMPFDEPSLLGTEKDGSKNPRYCKYCYRDGAFTRPNISLKEMQDHLLEIMKPLSKTDPQVGQLLDRLPHLERWRQDDPEK